MRSTKPFTGQAFRRPGRPTAVTLLAAALLWALAGCTALPGSGGTGAGGGSNDFTIVAYQGQDVLGNGQTKFSQVFQQHRPVVLNFWAGQCPPCRAEMPDLQAAYAELHPKGLVMLAVSLYEPMQAAADYAALNHVTYLIASDPRALATGTAYPIENFPTHILIDQDGIVRDEVLAELDKAGFLAHAKTIMPNA